MGELFPCRPQTFCFIWSLLALVSLLLARMCALWFLVVAIHAELSPDWCCALELKKFVPMTDETFCSLSMSRPRTHLPAMEALMVVEVVPLMVVDLLRMGAKETTLNLRAVVAMVAMVAEAAMVVVAITLPLLVLFQPKPKPRLNRGVALEALLRVI